MDNERRQSNSDMHTELAVLKERFESWMTSTVEFRKIQKDSWNQLCQKIDKISERLSELPCKQGEESYKDLANQLKVIWGLMVIGLGAMITDWFRKH